LTRSHGGVFDKRLSSTRLPFSYPATLARIYRRLRIIELSAATTRKLRELEARTRRQFDVSWDIENLCRQRFQNLVADIWIYERLLDRWQPKEVTLVVGYGPNVALTAAARKRGLPVRELQHGTFSHYHLGYAYPNRNRPPPAFPDELQVWSQAWKARLPFGKAFANITVKQPSWLAERKAKYANVPRRRRALVISQGLLGDRIAEALENVLPRLEAFEIRYKLHPGEISRYRSYPHLSALTATGRVTVLEACDLAEEFAAADLVVGVYSTAVYEAMELGCRVFLFDLPGVENLADLVENGEATLLSPDGPPIPVRNGL
jgi:hypothetical protein